MSQNAPVRDIVLFSARYLPNVGGVEFFTANLGTQLATMGHDVLVVTTETGDDAAADARRSVGEGSLEVFRLNQRGPTRAPFVVHDGRYRELCGRIGGLGPFHALINTRFYDLSRIAARLCRDKGVRPVLIDHGTGYIQFPSRLLSLASKMAEHAITANLKRYPIDYYGVSRDASRWLGTFGIGSCGEIHNALDADSFVGKGSGRDLRAELGIPDETLCVAYAARLLPEKGADTVLEAARELVDDRRFHFLVAGRGPMAETVAAAGEELPNLSYVGVLDHADLAAMLLQSDVFCLPTRYSEGLPTSLLEAAACGCALVASHAGGVDEIIAAEDQGIILAEPTAGDVVGALRRLADDRPLLDALKHGAHERVRDRFTWQATAGEVMAAFERAASAARQA